MNYKIKLKIIKILFIYQECKQLTIWTKASGLAAYQTFIVQSVYLEAKGTGSISHKVLLQFFKFHLHQYTFNSALFKN